ncbi:sensor histidine kinase [Streptacidiphilus sp. PAMC 29251]
MGVLALAAAIVGTAVLARTTAASNRLNDHISPARTAAVQLQAALLDQETGVRGYLLTGDTSLLEPYTRGLADEAGAKAQLTALMGDDRQSAADLAAVERSANAWRSGFAQPAIAARQSQGSVSVEQGKSAFDQLRKQLAATNGHLDQERAQARAQLGRMRTQRDLAFQSMLAVFLLTGAGLALLLHLTVVRPLNAMRAAARRVAGGDLDHRIPEQGPADLQTMAQAVEAMRLRVVTDLGASQRQEIQLREQAQQMDAQAAELRRSNTELEQFAYVASHDLQEPLRKIASFCQLLEKRYSVHLDERGLQYIAFAVDGAKRMQILINDLLGFSRVGRVHDARTEVALDEVLDQAVHNLAVAIEESDARILRPTTLPRVTGDPTLLTMLWQNLIGNAIKFRRPDLAPVIRITASADQDAGTGDGVTGAEVTGAEVTGAEVTGAEVTGAAAGVLWRFTVTDNGIGIPAEFADKVFVIFQRLHGRDAYEGTGIGLALCKKIIENSGGRIWIDTDHTDGTRLHFTLPLSEALPPTEGERPHVLEGTTP